MKKPKKNTAPPMEVEGFRNKKSKKSIKQKPKKIVGVFCPPVVPSELPDGDQDVVSSPANTAGVRRSAWSLRAHVECFT